MFQTAFLNEQNFPQLLLPNNPNKTDKKHKKPSLLYQILKCLLSNPSNVL